MDVLGIGISVRFRTSAMPVRTRTGYIRPPDTNADGVVGAYPFPPHVLRGWGQAFNLYSAVRCCMSFGRIRSIGTPDPPCMPCMGVMGKNSEVSGNHYRPCDSPGHDTRAPVDPVRAADWGARPLEGVGSEKKGQTGDRSRDTTP